MSHRPRESLQPMHIMASKHVVLHTGNFWGHMKPLVHFTARMLEARPGMMITILTNSVLYKKCVDEISRIGVPAERFRVVDFIGTPDPDFVAHVPEFEPTFRALWESTVVFCQSSGKHLEAILPPTTIVVDPLAHYVFPAVRTVAGSECQIAAWFCFGASVMLHFLSFGDYRPLLREKLESGMDLMKASHEIWPRPPKGIVLHTPGLPKVFDYEWIPQENELPHAMVCQHIYNCLTAADTTVLVAVREMEPSGAQAIRDLFESKGKSIWFIGPILSKAVNGDPKPVTPSASVVLSFLDRMQSTRGAQSVLYVSFGTLFWLMNPNRLWVFLEELTAADVPFVFAHAAPQAIVPPERKAAIEAKGTAIVVPWAPQEAVLAHPATRAFVTHGGWNGTQETLASRVVPIFWPIAADQPGNALLLTLAHKAGFEMLSVRTGAGTTGIPYRCLGGEAPEYSLSGVRKETRQLLQRLYGVEGDKARQNVGKLADVMGRAWEEAGSAREEMHGFLQNHVD